MRALSDQMEPMPPQARELKQALDVCKRERAEWELRAAVQEERAEKAEARADERARECADLFLKLKEAEAEAAWLRRIGAAILYHDERGQGVGYAEAMAAMRAALENSDE